MRPTRYENFHKHDELSNLVVPDSIAKPSQYIKRYKELGMKGYSLCNHGILMNYGEAYYEAKKSGFKPIFAVEAYVWVDKEATRMNHQLIIAKNNDGRKELNALLSKAWSERMFNKRNPIYLEEILQLNPDNFILTTTCIDSILSKHGDEAVEWYLKPLVNHFGSDNIYLEMQYHVWQPQIEYNQRLLKYKEEFGLKLFFATDSHYVYPEDAEYRTIMQESKGIFYEDDPENSFWLDVPDINTIYERFEKQGVLSEEQVTEAIESTIEVFEKIDNIELGTHIKMPSLYPEKSHEEKIQILKDLVIKLWREESKHIPKDKINLYKKQIAHEFKIIEKTKMEDYFLFNYEIMKLAKEKYSLKQTKTGRGSGVSFILNKILGFTDIDRISSTVQMYPERFMSVERIIETVSLPDFDFNMVSDEPVVKASIDILGEGHVYPMIALGTFKEASAFHLYSKAKGVPPKTREEIGKNLDSYINSSEYGDMVRKSREYMGVTESVSIHPCAYLLYDDDIASEVGLIKTTNTEGKQFTMALIDSYYSDVFKFLKNDYLKVTVYDIIYKVAELTEPIPSVADLIKYSEENPEIWKIYEDGVTATLNQTATDSARPQVMWYKPKTIAELSHFVAGIRPSFQSMKKKLFDRVEFSYGIPEFDKLLESSDNFILYQENIMAVLQYAGFPSGETYSLLKQIAKKRGDFEAIKERFFKGFMEKANIERDEVEYVWKVIEDAVGYSFNASHSYSVAVDSLYGAYYKHKYPVEYFSVILEIYKKDKTVAPQIFSELEYFNLKVNPLEFGKSRAEFYAIGREIYRGTSSVKGINKNTGNLLYDISKLVKENDDFVDVLNLCDEHNVSKSDIHKLIHVGYFKKYGGSRYLLNIWGMYYGEIKPPSKDKAFKIQGVKRSRETRFANLYEQISKLDKEENITPLELVRFEYGLFNQLESRHTQFHAKDYIVLDTLTKYKNAVVKIQSLKTGKIVNVTVKSAYFYDDNGKPKLKKGDVIRIHRSKKEELNKPVNINGEEVWKPSGEFKNYLYTWVKFK
jgi:DNA polymerase III alpha subunit